MASVQDSVDFPQCGGRAFVEFYTRTFEEEILCPRCGYCETTRPVIDRQKQKLDSEHRAWFKQRNDGERICRTTKHAGFGPYYIATKNGFGALGTVNGKLTARITEVTLVTANFKRDVTRPEIDAHRSFLTRWDPKKRCVEVIVGKILADFP